VTAIDLSAGMLEASALRDAGLAVTFAVGDAVDPAFPPRTCDAIVSRSVIWTLREPATAFRNWYQLLRPGGRVLAIYGLSPTAEPAFRDVTATALEALRGWETSPGSDLPSALVGYRSLGR
jgi:SAM-dependent methyltransferase